MSATPQLKLTDSFKDRARKTGLSHKLMERRQTIFPQGNQFSRTTHFFSKTPNAGESRARISLKPSQLLLSGSGQEQRVKKRDGSKGRRVRVEKSPYLSEAAPIERMLKLLIPVHGPNESMKLSIKKHNQMNIKNAELLYIMKKTGAFDDRMRAYAVRMGLPPDAKVFVMNSRDTHIREELLERGWAEGSDKETSLFHLKWVYKDSAADYGTLQEGQQYNHFKNNEQLTNKYLLQKNIKAFPSEDRPRIPLSYDLNSHEDSVAFQAVYLQIEACRLITTIAQDLNDSRPDLARKLETKKDLFMEYSGPLKPQSPRRASQVTWPLLYKSSPSSLQSNKPTWEVLTSLFKVVCFVVGFVSKKLRIHYCCFRLRPSCTEIGDCLKLLNQELEFGVSNALEELSTFYIMEILKLSLRCREVEGANSGENIWILKPSGVSRGSGIVITGDYTRILSLRHGKVVQKYIERPLLLECGRKFDLRQWVLVRSFSPLQAYVYRRCYGRFSSVKYSNSQHENHQKHLTNYSANKDSYFKLRQHSHIPTQPLLPTALPEEEIVRQLGSKWWQLKQAIKSDIVRTLLCCRNQIVRKEGCFEVYGFDILIDEHYRPHVLEVNLSPACENREFLGGYLGEMAQGLVDMFEGGEPTHWERLSTTEPGFLTRRCSHRMDETLSKIRTIQRWWRRQARKG